MLSAERLRIELISGEVWVDGRRIEVRQQQFELLAFLALRAGAVSTAAVCAALYPRVAPAQARARLELLVDSVRAQLGCSAIERGEEGLRLTPSIALDVNELLKTVHALSIRLSSLAESERDTLVELGASLRREKFKKPRCWAWFAPLDAEWVRVGSDIAILVAREELRRCKPVRALAVARGRIDEDPLDERARETAMLAYVALGNLERARAEYDDYSERLRLCAGGRPGFDLERIVKRFRTRSFSDADAGARRLHAVT